MQQLNVSFLKAFFRLAAERLEENRHRLCELDGEIGDGDHGTSMANGFAAVVASQRDVNEGSGTPDVLLRNSAAAFLSEVGATVGPLYAGAMLRAAKLFEGHDAIAIDKLGLFLEAMGSAIAERGGARLGDKTMIDAWLPAAHRAKTMLDKGCSPSEAARGAAQAADEAAASTISMIASRGRAARLNERSLGHLDPGAVSASIILQAFADTVDKVAKSGR